MKSVNLANVEESNGEFGRLVPGGYVIRITDVKDVPFDQKTGKGDYLKIYFDVAEGELKGIYENMRKDHSDWSLDSFIRSYKEKALPMFKRFCRVVSNSNGNYVFDPQGANPDEQTLKGKVLGAVFREEEYRKNDGTIGTRMSLSGVYTPDEIREGKFKVPGLKKLNDGGGSTSGTTTNPGDDFMNVPEGINEELPFT